MHLSDHDLKQLNGDSLSRLSPKPLLRLAVNLLEDLKEARDRLNRTPENSSQPPSTRAPWEKPDPIDDYESKAQDLLEPSALETQDAATEEAPQIPPEPDKTKQIEDAPTKPRRPGRRPGAPGVSRTQQLPITAEETHRPESCAACGAPLDTAAEEKAYTARYEIDVTSPDNGMPGLVVTQTKHTYVECQCGCGHTTRAEPGRAETEDGWEVALTEWHLAGPMLVALICSLALRMRLSRRRIKELLHDWLGLDFGIATINQCIHEAGRAVDPVVQTEILEAVRQAGVLHADETTWPEGTLLLWLWVLTCTTATLFVVGRRTKELFVRVLSASFAGWLMSDGYMAYRDFDQRLRCWAHIIRKARGLAQSLDRRANPFGTLVLTLFNEMVQAVYQARAAPPAVSLREQYAQKLRDLYAACVHHAESTHEKTRALARELLNDWDTFWVVLEYPELPLTNNDAERELRHWVIARRISHGTRTEQGTTAFANLASVIETCRKRSALPWPYIAEVVKQRRKGLSAPALPPVAVE